MSSRCCPVNSSANAAANLFVLFGVAAQQPINCCTAETAKSGEAYHASSDSGSIPARRMIAVRAAWISSTALRVSSGALVASVPEGRSYPSQSIIAESRRVIRRCQAA